MSWFSKFVSDGIVETVSSVADIVDKFIETPDEKRVFKTIMARMAQEPNKAQIELNKIGAANRSIFIAGWRPYIGWIAGTGLAIYFLPQYIVGCILWTKVSLIYIENWEIGSQLLLPKYPVNSEGLMELVLGMLGLAGMRTIEKLTGRAK